MTNRSRISLIMGKIGPEHSELFVLEFKKMLNLTCTSIYINQSALNLVEMYVTVRSLINFNNGYN